MKKMIIFTVLGLLTILLLCGWVFYTIQKEQGSDHRRAERVALENTVMSKIDRVETFHGDQKVEVVYGANQHGRKILVWVFDDDFHLEFASEGISKTKAKQLLLSEAGQGDSIEILRTSAGIWEEEYVWEIFYKQKEEGDFRHYYRYYRFSDGTLLETLKLDKE